MGFPFFGRSGRPAALILVAGLATAQEAPQICNDWQAKFYAVRATWRGGATTRAEIERTFGAAARLESSGPCAVLHYTVSGCACTFVVCSAGTVVSKTLTVGAAAVPAFITSEPAGMARSMEALEASLQETQSRLEEIREAMASLAPAPAPAGAPVREPASAKPARPAPKAAPAARTQCTAFTSKGARCTRDAASGGAYCWQHRR